MNKEEALLLYEYNRWANDRICEAASALSPAQFIKDLESSHRSVRDTLVHIMSGEWIWLQRWQGQSPMAMLDPADFPSLLVLRAKWNEIELDQMAFVQSVTDASLKKIVSYENLQGETWRYPLLRMLQHVMNHSTYHRGQVVTMLRQLGIQPAATDFLVFLDMKPANGAVAPPAKRQPAAFESEE